MSELGSTVDRHWLARTVELAELCPPATSAYSVGCVILSGDGEVLAEGHSRQRDPHDHAEEVALDQIPAGLELSRATLYSSMEPCGSRASRDRPCAERIISAGVGRVIYAWSEPPLFVVARGVQRLRAAGVHTLQIPELAESAQKPNAHLPHNA